MAVALTRAIAYCGVYMGEPQYNTELHKQANRFGGLLDPRELLAPWDKQLLHFQDLANTLVDSLRTHMHDQWKDRALHVEFVRSDEVNAWAVPGTEADYVFISLGAIEKIYGTMSALFCCPKCFPHVGNPDGEKEPKGPFEGGLPRWPMTDGQDASACCLPADEERIAAAMMLADIALEFIIYHEVGHVLGGHLELSSRRLGRAKMSEANTPVEVRNMVLSQVLELDADLFAAHVDGIVTFWQGTHESWSETFCWPGVSSRDAAIMAYAFAIGVLFRVLERDGDLPASMGDSHPHPAVRCNSAVSWSFAWACVEQLADIKKLQEVIAEPLRMIEHLWERLHLPVRRLALSPVFADQLVKLTGELKAEYDARASLLDGYARLPAKWRGR